MRHRLLAVPVGISLAAAAITGTAGAAAARANHAAGVAGNSPGTTSPSSATFDSRTSAPPLRASGAQTAAARSLVRSASGAATGGAATGGAAAGGFADGVRVTYDPLFATPRELVHYGGYLTGPVRGGVAAARGGAAGIARAWINAHRAAFGLTAADVKALAVSRDYTNPTSRTHVITFTQVFGGLRAVFGGRLNVSVTRDGRILNYTGDPRPSANLSAKQQLTSADAVAAVARSKAPRAAYRPAVTGRSGVWTRFARGPFGGAQYARPAAFPTAQGVRPAYEVIFTASTSDMIDAAVDAVTGKILYRQSLTADESDNETTPGPGVSAAAKVKGPAGLAFLYYPGAPAAPT